MKILIAGRFAYPWYEDACAGALSDLGHEVVKCNYSSRTASSIARIEEGLSLCGPATLALNAALLRSTSEAMPHAVLMWRGTQILPGTLRAIKRRTHAVLASYNNDDPFSPGYAHMHRMLHRVRLWRYFKQCIPEYDVNFVFRQKNIDEYLAAGARRAAVLMPYFVPAIHRPVRLTPDDKVRYGADVVFVGHYEDDGRADYLRALIHAGVSVKLYGPHWPSRVTRALFDAEVSVRPVIGDEYAKVLSASRICLSFHSRLNRDTYTRRSFEIPACEGLLLSERTDELCRLFEEGTEALYFSSPAELVEKAQWALATPRAAELIRKRARERCIRDEHHVRGRMQQLISALSAIQ